MQVGAFSTTIEKRRVYPKSEYHVDATLVFFRLPVSEDIDNIIA